MFSNVFLLLLQDDVIQSWVCRRVETEHFVPDCGISNNGNNEKLSLNLVDF